MWGKECCSVGISVGVERAVAVVRSAASENVRRSLYPYNSEFI